ncbi:hypothetical protein Asi03nite_49100 [Actinoplanes siamensis]|uniref:Uncharacterized protein n=1 Tax=Actinoplanes siamensis TaxID=1223317 RepID=A0A919TM73_9ACTN|nr:hypothetical protein Asi03nite_49100 [Actinoplanes siamensis]
MVAPETAGRTGTTTSGKGFEGQSSRGGRPPPARRYGIDTVGEPEKKCPRVSVPG